MANGSQRAAAADPGGVTAGAFRSNRALGPSESSFLTMASRRASKDLICPSSSCLPTSAFKVSRSSALRPSNTCRSQRVTLRRHFERRVLAESPRVIDQPEPPVLGVDDVALVAIGIGDELVEEIHHRPLAAVVVAIGRLDLVLDLVAFVHQDVVDPPGKRRRRRAMGAADAGRHHVQPDQAVDLVRGDVEHPAVAEIELDALVGAELTLRLVDVLDVRVVRQLAVGQGRAERVRDAFLRALGADDVRFFQEPLDFAVRRNWREDHCRNDRRWCRNGDRCCRGLTASLGCRQRDRRREEEPSAHEELLQNR